MNHAVRDHTCRGTFIEPQDRPNIIWGHGTLQPASISILLGETLPVRFDRVAWWT